MKKPEWKSEKGESFFDSFERYMTERDQWERSTWRGRITKLWWRIRRAVTDAWWFIRWETTDRYHMLDLRGHGYKRGYIDYDERFLRAAFRCLEMMEEEQWGFKDVTEADLAPEDDPNDPWAAQANIGMRAQIELYREFKELLRWWREVRPTLDEPRDGEDYHTASERARKEEDEKLTRLVQLRGHMWA